MSIFKKKANSKATSAMNHTIESTEVDKHLELKMSSLFSLMQEVASQQLEDFGIGKTATVDIGLYWVITRYAIDIQRMPKYLESIEISTYFQKASKFLFTRNFLIRDSKGDVIVKASSVWCVLNKSTHSINLNPFPDKEIPVHDSDEGISSPEKISGDSINLIDSRKVRYTDLDLHGHVSNTKYIDYIIDSHDEQFYDTNKIIRFEINYEKELMSGNSFEVYSDSNSPEIILIKSNGEAIDHARITYSKR